MPDTAGMEEEMQLVEVTKDTEAKDVGVTAGDRTDIVLGATEGLDPETNTAAGSVEVVAEDGGVEGMPVISVRAKGLEQDIATSTAGAESGQVVIQAGFLCPGILPFISH